jgi:hypothetical protein
VNRTGGIDLSFSSCSLAQARALLNSGDPPYRIAVQNLWTGASRPGVREANLRNLKAAGFIIAGYTVVNASQGANCVNIARDGIPADLWNDLACLFIDVEVDGTQKHHVDAAVDRADSMGKGRCVYTAHWFWHGRMGNPAKPPNTMLWNAFYDDAGDIDFPRAPYCGWTVPELCGEQYTNSHLEHGVEIDSNTFDLDFFQHAPTQPPAEAEDGDMRIIGHPSDARAFLVVGSKAYHIPDGDTWEDLRRVCYGADDDHTAQPHQLRPETYAWLRDNNILVGLP